ncbi:dienelactone hydrolase family protein [Rhizobium sp. Rhizsp82]|uniref:dienelactone hydrolase family protein n=1 Tax=Rhizobium sp. Rhizsp82 TaxID=3243057 RepID=UPI0039B5583C
MSTSEAKPILLTRLASIVVSALCYLTLCDATIAADGFTMSTRGGPVVVEGRKETGTPRPAVVVLSGSAGFRSPAYDEIAEALQSAGLDVYLVHILSPTDLKRIADAGGAKERLAYYATRETDWIAAVKDVVAYLRTTPGPARKVGALGISLGAQIAAAATVNNANVAALVLVDGGLPNGYSEIVRSLPPLLLIWGRADQTFPLSTGRKLQKLADDLGGPADLDIYEGPHDFFLKSKTQESRAAHDSAVKFLRSQLSK